MNKIPTGFYSHFFSFTSLFFNSLQPFKILKPQYFTSPRESKIFPLKSHRSNNSRKKIFQGRLFDIRGECSSFIIKYRGRAILIKYTQLPRPLSSAINKKINLCTGKRECCLKWMSTTWSLTKITLCLNKKKKKSRTWILLGESVLMFTWRHS